MASGFIVTGRGDLDALLMARVSAARANVGFAVAGVDVANRYEPIGANTPIGATGFVSAGVDLASLFRGSGVVASAAVTPADFFNSNASGTFISTSSATCTVTGNAGAPVYAWSRVSGSSKITPGNSAAAVTNFLVTGLAQFESVQAVFKCTVTVDGHSFDAAGTCTVTMYRT